jgi:ElaB/YqjD/DUF883 family membrane-anchored ribosome-binding protein
MATGSSQEPSVAELRRDADRTRAHLTGTVEELRSQVADTATHVREAVSPATIKRQVKDYVRESSEDMLQSLQRRARDNPLQAVAIGAGVAYPLWNLFRAVPAPLLLIGAGLALSRSSAVREATDEALARAREAADHAAGMTRQKMEEWRDTAGSVVDRATELASSARDRVSAAVSDAKESGTDFATTATRTSATNGGNAAMDRTRAALDTASERATSLAAQAKDTLTNTYEQNPLLVAGIGLAVGALIASSLPTTSTENRLFGDTSDRLRRRAVDAAAQGLDAAKEAADNVVEAAAQEGLSAEGLSSAADDLTRKARGVVESGVEAALGRSNPSNPTSSPTSPTSSPTKPTSGPTT